MGIDEQTLREIPRCGRTVGRQVEPDDRNTQVSELRDCRVGPLRMMPGSKLKPLEAFGSVTVCPMKPEGWPDGPVKPLVSIAAN